VPKRNNHDEEAVREKESGMQHVSGDWLDSVTIDIDLARLLLRNENIFLVSFSLIM
jgi:hypothetical protein